MIQPRAGEVHPQGEARERAEGSIGGANRGVGAALAKMTSHGSVKREVVVAAEESQRLTRRVGSKAGALLEGASQHRDLLDGRAGARVESRIVAPPSSGQIHTAWGAVADAHPFTPPFGGLSRAGCRRGCSMLTS